MKLKQIILHGFKSFADRTVFDIHAGVSCVVGPNGCGKSNIVESVRWVLGEQSIKQLRGTDRTDVIFQGSSSRKALNLAEVSLVFDNQSRKLNYPADEVTVTRRLYRNGESQYLINKSQCLLRNIKELFLDTGVGTSSYSIIQQGRVKALLEANGKDRRQVFEEAAGIGKYMVHRGRTMRTLERIQNRLDAFRGILTDARKQYKSALKQAERTLEAEAIRKQLEGQQKVLYLIQYSDATEQLGQLEQNLTQLESELHTSDERRAQLAAQEAETQQKRAESTNRSYAAKSRSIEMEGQIARLQSESMSQKAMADSEDKLAIQTGLRAEELQKQSGEARMQAEQARADLSAAESERQPQAQRCAEYARDLAAARAEQQRLAEAEEAAAQAYNRAQQELARTGAEQSAVAARLEANRAALAQAETALAALTTELARLEQQATDLAAACAEQQAATDRQQAACEALAAARAALEERRRDLTARQEALREEINHAHGRRQTAEQFLAAELRKADSPARIAERLNGAAPAAAGVPPAQALIDQLHADPEWAAALEIALGEFTRAVLLPDHASLQHALALPPAAGAFLLSRQAPTTEPTRGPRPAADATLLNPADRVTLAADLQPLVAWLFGGVALTASLTAAAIAAARAAGLHTLVDRQGAVWKNGLYRAAATIAAAGATTDRGAAGTTAEPELSTLGVLGLRTEIERLGGKLADMQARKIELTTEAERLSAEIQQHEAERETAQRALSDLKSRLEWTTRQRESADRERDQAAQNVIRRQEEIAGLVARVSADETRAAELEARHAELTAAIATLDAQLSELREARRSTAEKLHTLGETYREAQALLSKLEQICESRRMEAESAERRADRLEVETKTVQEAAANHRAAAEAGWKQAELSRARAEELVAEAAACKSQAEELEKAVAELSAALSAISSEKNGLEDRLRQARDSFSRLQLDHQRVRMERDAILEKAQAEFRVDLAEVMKKRETPPPAVEEVAEGGDAAPGAGDPAATEPAAANATTGDAGAAADLAEADAVQAEVAHDLTDVAQEVQLNIANLLPPHGHEHTEITVPKEVDPFEAATLDLAMIPVIRERINKLRESLDAFGEINWNALQLKRETELRVQFLEEQFTDLETARDRLRDILATINRKSRELFTTCFNDVRARFGGMFRKLFGGGQAEIFLEQNVDVLEAGIEIVAKPPGKEPQHLSQLSGGEKTMTTIGLLMSIYQIKPSPFCIMDEIDADLDGPNVDRLNLTIKEFLDRSQFLVISHRPRTMTYADVLYGISMNMVGPDSGVSKRVSIAFEEIEEQYGSEDLPDSAKSENNADSSQAAG